MFRLSIILNIIINSFLWPCYGPREAVAQQTTTFPIFRQEEALRAAKSKEILSYMNLSANPCEDFYEFACGNWNKFHTPPTKNEVETQQSLLESHINKELRRILDENTTVDDSGTARKVKVFYKSCLEARRDEIQHQLFLSDFIKNNGGFPAVTGSNWLAHHHSYDWQHVVAGLRYNYGIDILVGMDIDINYQNIHENSIYLTEPSTFIPRHLCSSQGTKRVEVTDHEYDPLEQEVAENLRLWLSLKKEDALMFAADIVTFEYDLCTAMYVNETQEQEEFIGSLSPEEVHKEYPRKRLAEFTHEYNNSIDFNAIVRDSFGVPMYKPVFMKSPQYYEQLIKVIDDYEEYNKTIIANYIMYRALTIINLPANDSPLNRPAHCLQVVKKYFPKVLGEMYHRKHANTADQDEVQTMFSKIKDIFEKSLLGNWIDKSTGLIGKTKLDELVLQFPSYDKYSTSLEFVRNDYWKNLKLIMAEVRVLEVSRVFTTGLPRPKDEVEAYETRLVHRPYHKRIDIGWGVLQPPYYYSQLPTSMRYALIGQKLAQTLVSAFDEYSWMADKNGHGNWDPQTAVEYYKRANCFREQIGNYLHNDPFSFNNATWTREIIAKSGGLNSAFNAYIDWLHYQDPINDQIGLHKETLAELNLSNTQLFFITFAQMHCKGQKRLKKPELGIVISPLVNHSMYRYEVNGPLRNFREFAREFQCPVGGQMNTADPCLIY